MYGYPSFSFHPSECRCVSKDFRSIVTHERRHERNCFILLVSSGSYQAILPCLLCVIVQILDHITMEKESNQSVSDIQMQNPVKQTDRSSRSSKCRWNHPNPSSNQFRKLAHMWWNIWFRQFGNWGEPPRSRNQNAKSCKTDREGP